MGSSVVLELEFEHPSVCFPNAEHSEQRLHNGRCLLPEVIFQEVSRETSLQNHAGSYCGSDRAPES